MLAPMRWLLLLPLLACSQPRAAVLYGSASPLGPSDYAAVLETWTRDARLYQGFDDKLFVKATYHAPELRRAFAIAFPDIYGHGGEVTRRELVDLSGDVEQSHTFFLSVYTPNRKWNDLNKADSIWRIELRGEGDVAVSPRETIQVKVDANIKAVYPHIDRFEKAYLVRFPQSDITQAVVVGPDTLQFTLRLASALGVAEMSWQLVPISSQ
jgi:hypothetical protein